jgi:hypothetical protein
MKWMKRILMAAGAIAIAASMITLVKPKVVHAAVATLVQVVNTISDPAITQDTSKTASQIVNMFCNPSANEVPCQSGGADYKVPKGQTLVITSIVITPQFSNTGTQTAEIFAGVGFVQSLNVTNTTSTEFLYPSGIVIPSGYAIRAGSGPSDLIWVNGYLTAN